MSRTLRRQNSNVEDDYEYNEEYEQMRLSDENEKYRLLIIAANSDISMEHLVYLARAYRNNLITPIQFDNLVTHTITYRPALDTMSTRIWLSENDTLRVQPVNRVNLQRIEVERRRTSPPPAAPELNANIRSRIEEALTIVDRVENEEAEETEEDEEDEEHENRAEEVVNFHDVEDEINFLYKLTPKEPIYNRRKMKNLVNVNFNDNFATVVNYIGICKVEMASIQEVQNLLPRCLHFTHNVSIDDGGLAKQWFTHKYTSLEILKFIHNLQNIPQYCAIFSEDTTKIKVNFYSYMQLISRFINLGYINFRWLHISDDLLDLLYISYKIHEPEKHKSKYKYENNKSKYYSLCNSYLEKITYNRFVEFDENFDKSHENLVEILHFMKKKVTDNFSTVESQNYINRKHLIAYLYYNEYENAKKENKSDLIQEYYLIKIAKLFNKNKQDFTENLQYINTNTEIKTNTIDNFSEAIKLRILYEIKDKINFEDFVLKYKEIYNVLVYFLPDKMSIEMAYTHGRTDACPEFLKDTNKQLLYAHLINDNEIVDIEKIISVINFPHNALTFVAEEKNKFKDVIRSMSNTEAFNFLKFVTGTDRIPPSIVINKTHGELAAHTCSNQLDIPVDFISINDIDTIKIALTTEFTNDFTIAGGGINNENNSMSNVINSVFLAGIVLVSSLLQSM